MSADGGRIGHHSTSHSIATPAQVAVVVAGLDLDRRLRQPGQVARASAPPRRSTTAGAGAAGTYHSGARCGRPFGPMLAQVRTRCSARKAAILASVIRIRCPPVHGATLSTVLPGRRTLHPRRRLRRATASLPRRACLYGFGMRSTMMPMPLQVSRILRTAAPCTPAARWSPGPAHPAPPAGPPSPTSAAPRARLANALRDDLGVTGDQRVATLMWNNSEHLATYLAVPAWARCCTR
jgi:hypothetical protein